MMPERSPKAKKAKSVFFRQENEIDIYIEDTEKGVIKLYTILFQRAFEGKYQVSRIHPLGGKEEVLKFWKKLHAKPKRPELYVIDSDFSLASPEKMLSPYNHSGKGLLYTTRFCIENYLINEAAALSYLDKKDPNLLKSELKAKLNFRKWLANISKPLQKLFFHLYTARAISHDIPVMNWKYSNIISNGAGDIDQVKIENICEEIKNHALQFTDINSWISTYKQIKDELISKYSKNIQYYICGKNYLLGLLILRMKSITDHREKNILIKQSLARNTSVSILKEELCVAI